MEAPAVGGGLAADGQAPAGSREPAWAGFRAERGWLDGVLVGGQVLGLAEDRLDQARLGVRAVGRGVFEGGADEVAEAPLAGGGEPGAPGAG